MNDLISRAAALDVINTWGRQKSEKVRMGLLHRDLDAIPAVDAAPVVHGRWLDERPNTYTRKVKCSVCNGPAPFICRSADYYGRNMHGDFAKTKYCPCCGAKMDGDKNEQ